MPWSVCLSRRTVRRLLARIDYVSRVIKSAGVGLALLKECGTLQARLTDGQEYHPKCAKYPKRTREDAAELSGSKQTSFYMKYRNSAAPACGMLYERSHVQQPVIMLKFLYPTLQSDVRHDSLCPQHAITCRNLLKQTLWGP